MKCSPAGLNTAAVASLNTWLAFNCSWPLFLPLPPRVVRKQVLFNTDIMNTRQSVLRVFKIWQEY